MIEWFYVRRVSIDWWVNWFMLYFRFSSLFSIIRVPFSIFLHEFMTLVNFIWIRCILDSTTISSKNIQFILMCYRKCVYIDEILILLNHFLGIKRIKVKPKFKRKKKSLLMIIITIKRNENISVLDWWWWDWHYNYMDDGKTVRDFKTCCWTARDRWEGDAGMDL